MAAIEQTAKECFATCGMFPISFCLPVQKVRPFREKPKTKELSFIVPGDPRTFVFADEDGYMNEYQTSKFARTRKKGGWDCVRHLEIMAASCLPIFERIEECPQYTMVHYPKALFKQIKDRVGHISDPEYDRLVAEVYDWLVQRQTSDRMVEYMLEVSGNEGAQRVLFVDRELTEKPDCQSAMVLGGLKNTFGRSCEVAYPIECMYSGRPFPRRPRWWRTNFNIYGVLDDACRSRNEERPDIERILASIRAREYDLVVYGSVTRSLDLFAAVTEHYPRERVLCINGEDDNFSGPPRTAPLAERLKQRLRNFTRRHQYSGPQLDPALDSHAQWRTLLAEIQPKSTVFVRELAVPWETGDPPTPRPSQGERAPGRVTLTPCTSSSLATGRRCRAG